MSSPTSGSSSVATRLRLTHTTEESTAAGIHGVVVSAAVMAASHASSATALILGVMVTLAIYWSAERYSRLVAERIHAGHMPTWRGLRRHLTAGWEMVAASALPTAVLAGLRLLGTSLDTAVTSALVCSTFLLCLAGWEVGRFTRLSGLERLGSTVVAGMFGVALVSLKALLH